VDRGDVDDPPAVALAHHLARRGLGAEERTLEIDSEHEIPAALIDLEKGLLLLDAGVVDEDVDPTEVPNDVIDRKKQGFGLPMLEYVDPDEDEVQALVLTPTRELCIQVTQALRTYGARKGVDVVAVFGGAPIRSQQAQLRAGGQVVVGTVGRVLDLISRRSLMLTSCRYLVLDEAEPGRGARFRLTLPGEPASEG